MKTTRIKYKRTNLGQYESVQSFLANDGVLVKAWIDPVNCIVTICNHQGDVQEDETCTSFTKCKTRAKQLLKNCGVSFFEETRTKKAKV